MSGPLVGAVLNDARSRKPAVRFVLAVIAEQQRKPDQSVRLSLAYLCRMTGYQRRHVIDAVHEAEANGDLAVIREDGRSNEYRVLPEPVAQGAPPPVHHKTPGGAPQDTGPVALGAPTPSVLPVDTRDAPSGHADGSAARPPGATADARRLGSTDPRPGFFEGTPAPSRHRFDFTECEECHGPKLEKPGTGGNICKSCLPAFEAKLDAHRRAVMGR